MLMTASPRLGYSFLMKTFHWNNQKNDQLKAERGISFEDILLALQYDGLLDVLQHPNRAKYPNQSVFVVTHLWICLPGTFC
jgi:hypothetical protein